MGIGDGMLRWDKTKDGIHICSSNEISILLIKLAVDKSAYSIATAITQHLYESTEID